MNFVDFAAAVAAELPAEAAVAVAGLPVAAADASFAIVDNSVAFEIAIVAAQCPQRACYHIEKTLHWNYSPCCLDLRLQLLMYCCLAWRRIGCGSSCLVAVEIAVTLEEGFQNALDYTVSNYNMGVAF